MPKNTLNDIKLTNPKARKAYEAFRAFLIQEERTDTGGCTTFYTPQEWKARGEEYGKDALFIIVHDGGDVAPVCNLDYESYQLNDRMITHMAKYGVFVEQCTSWYSAVYES